MLKLGMKLWLQELETPWLVLPNCVEVILIEPENSFYSTLNLIVSSQRLLQTETV